MKVGVIGLEFPSLFFGLMELTQMENVCSRASLAGVFGIRCTSMAKIA